MTGFAPVSGRAWFAAVCMAFVLSLGSVCRAAGADISAKLRNAKAGDTVTLPAGTFAGGIKLPAGVSLRGAGFGQTIIDAAGHDVGIHVAGKAAATISDLAVINAGQTGVLLDEAKNITVERIAVSNGVNGLIMRNSEDCHAHNVVLTGNRAGALLTGNKGGSLVNATVANNLATALVLSGNEKTVVFNNILAGSQLGVSYGDNKDVTLDHNLYVCNFAGRLPGHPPRKHVGAWRDLSGQDRQSFTADIAYADVARGDYTPVSVQPWALDRSTSSNFGAAELAGIKAPETDIAGKPRVGVTDLGAFESSPAPTRPADGTFEVSTGKGVVSAGLFTKDGRNVAYLFQALPLAAGKHSYWFPTRDWQGRPIAAGHYELRIVEADLALKYLMPAGNTDPETSKRLPSRTHDRASMSPQAMGFDSKGNILLAQSGFENGIHLRSFDPELKHALWHLPGGGDSAGLAILGGNVHVIRRPNSLIRLNAATGQSAPFTVGGFQRNYENVFQSINGLAALDGKLFAADTTANKVHILAGDQLDAAGSFDVPAPTQISADDKNGLLWLISGGAEVLVLDAAGQVKHKATPVAKPTLLAAGGGRLAIYSEETNQVTLFDAADPANLKPIKTIGQGGEASGGGGYGKIEADKFWKPYALAVGPAGELLVADPPRLILFNPDGSVRRQHVGYWGQGITHGEFADGKPHYFNIGGGYDLIFDAPNQTWETGTRYRMPADHSPMGYFSTGGKNYGVFMGNKPVASVLVVSLEENGDLKPLIRYAMGEGGLVSLRDSNGDGIVGNAGEADEAKPVLGGDGAQIASFLWEARASTECLPDGSLLTPNRKAVLLLPFKGVEDGVPVHDFAALRRMPGTVEGKATYVSPFDFTTEETVSMAEDIAWHGDAGFATTMSTKTGSGPDLCTEHANSTQMAGYDAAGAMRWFVPMNPVGLKVGLHGLEAVAGLSVVSRGALCEVETLDIDGLRTGSLGMPADMGWEGMWVDNHRQLQGFTGADGRGYVIIGDYAAQAYHWLELTGVKDIKRQAVAVSINDATAGTLAAAAAQPVGVWPVPAPPGVIIRKLAAPLPIDGDVEKWRKLGIQPIVITPDTGGGDGPADSSAIVRIAYHGTNLYVHIIKFDDLLTFHHSEQGKHYLQDGIEFTLNTFPSGFKYNVTRLVGKGDVVYRDTWYRQGDNINQLLPVEVAPRVIQILETAESLEDRKLIEPAYGVDLGKGKAMVIEFMIPASAMEPMDSGLKVEFAPGSTFRLGIMINDNDLPGSETMSPMVWPVTYGTFERIDKSAVATFE